MRDYIGATSATGSAWGAHAVARDAAGGVGSATTGRRDRLGRPPSTPTLRSCLSHHGGRMSSRRTRYFSRSCSGRSGGIPRRTVTK